MYTMSDINNIEDLYNKINSASKIELKDKNSSNSSLDFFIIITMEVGIPFASGFLGVGDLLTGHFSSYLSKATIYSLSTALAGIDTAVNAALLVPVFRKMLKIPSPPPTTAQESKRQKLLFYEETLNKLVDPTFFETQSYQSYQTYCKKIKELYVSENFVSHANLTKEKNIMDFLKWALKWFLITVFLALRISSSYYIITKSLTILMLSNFIFTAPGIIMIGITIGLYLYAGYRTRHDAIDALIYAKEKQEKELNIKIQKVNSIYAAKESHMSLILENFKKNPRHSPKLFRPLGEDNTTAALKKSHSCPTLVV